MTEEIDAIVIGCGAGGAAAAWRLAKGGAKVLVIEGGPRFDPARDYRLDKPDWETSVFPEPPMSRWPYVSEATKKAALLDEDLTSWPHIVGPYNTETYRRFFGYHHVRGVCGSTLRFTGEAHRMHPDAMQMKTRFGVAADWPVSYEELEPYYIEVEKVIGVAGPTRQGARWRSNPFPLPAHPQSYASHYFGKAAQRLGLQWEANSVASLSETYQGRAPCNYCGNCQRGCPVGDKGSADITFVADALRTGNIAIRTHSQVISLETGPDDRVKRAILMDRQGRKQAVAARQFVLAGGAIQTPRLLMLSKDGKSSDGLSNESGQVGKNFMETLFWSSAGIHRDNIGSHRGHPSDGIIWDFNAPDSIPDVVGGFRITPSTAESDFLDPINYAKRVVPGWGADHKKSMRDSFGRVLALGAIGEFLPSKDSYIDLDPKAQDPFGLPLPRITSAHQKQDIARLSFMAKTVRTMLQAAGVTKIFEEAGSWDLVNASHLFGTCRMGENDKEAVVDRWGRSFKWRNLHIADASVFPSSGGGESPSLTIQALALRTADRILKQAN